MWLRGERGQSKGETSLKAKVRREESGRRRQRCPEGRMSATDAWKSVPSGVTQGQIPEPRHRLAMNQWCNSWRGVAAPGVSMS